MSEPADEMILFYVSLQDMIAFTTPAGPAGLQDDTSLQDMSLQDMIASKMSCSQSFEAFWSSTAA